MRADMKKVLTERERSGSHRCYGEVRAAETRHDYDDLPTHQGMRRPYRAWGTYKEFSDLLGPLRSFMRSCVGRRYDDVWSEICANVRADSMAGDHLREHAKRECDTNTTVIDGRVVSRSELAYFRSRSSGYEPWGLYVDPRDSLIYYNKPPSYRRKPLIIVDGLAYTAGKDGLLHPRKGHYGGRYLLKVIGDQRAMHINGVWYWIIAAEVPPPVSVPYLKEGKVRRRTVYHPRYDFVRGENVQEGRYYAEKRQMCSRDLRRHGLRNP
jgi:hypothetical protein